MSRQSRYACCLPLSPRHARDELVISLLFQLQSAARRTPEMSDAATPRTSARSVNPPAGSAFPRHAGAPCSFPWLKHALCAREILGTEQLFSHRYELRIQHRLESVATRTPPPICTSAQGSQTALVLRTVERRERSNNYTMVWF